MTTETKQIKVCGRCGQELPTSDFYSDSRTADGFSKVCRNCKREEKREARLLRKELGKDLSSFKPRELIEELRARGYKGKLTYTHTIEL